MVDLLDQLSSLEQDLLRLAARMRADAETEAKGANVTRSTLSSQSFYSRARVYRYCAEAVVACLLEHQPAERHPLLKEQVRALAAEIMAERRESWARHGQRS